MLKIGMVSTKGGVGKSLLTRYIAHGLTALGKQVSVLNLDQQIHVQVETDQARLESSEIVIFDSMGALHGATLELLEDLKSGGVVICPVGTGQSDQTEYSFIVDAFTQLGVMKQVVFVLNRVNQRCVSTREARQRLEGLGCTVAESTISALEDYAQWRNTPRTTTEIQKLIKEVIL